jgi:23S rRNA (uridine2552-2'-O)-methyltransferase
MARGGKRGGSGRMMATRVYTARGRPNASTRWLQRQLNDPYVKNAQVAGYRSRAAFKLVELDDRFDLLKPSKRIVDLGSAPGGWTQVSVERTKNACIVSADIQAVDPIDGAEVLELDIYADDAIRRLYAALGNERADLVLSDMAPSTTGHKKTDQIRIGALAEAAYDVARQLLAPDGAFAVKVFQGGAPPSLLDDLKRGFTSVRHAKPPASRSDSSEMYLVATGFRGAGGAPLDS